MITFTKEKLDEKKEIVAKLTYQLEAALADARRQAESQREKNIAKVSFVCSLFCVQCAQGHNSSVNMKACE